MKIALIHFPGSNNENDWLFTMRHLWQIDLVRVHHQDTVLPAVSGIIIPGGFSFGDYLRAGALAARSSIMSEIISAAQKGMPILGICNGFQILTESGLLPGSLLQNIGMNFICDIVKLQSCSGLSVYQQKIPQNDYIQLPIAHGQGRYFINDDGLKSIEDNNQIVFRYRNNPNGSIADIAGICSKNKKILGMMPHPERASLEILGRSTHGKQILECFLSLCG